MNINTPLLYELIAEKFEAEVRVKVLEGAIKKAAKEFNGLTWGYDGDCGSDFIICELEEVLIKDDK